jgi:hypothetical protein
MKKSFSIVYHNKDINVDGHEGGKEFSVHLPGNDLHLLLKEDDEGATHWFEKGTDNETGASKEIGILIEKEISGISRN